MCVIWYKFLLQALLYCKGVVLATRALSLANKNQTTKHYCKKTPKLNILNPKTQRSSHSSPHPARFWSCLNCLLVHRLIRSSAENLQGWRFLSFPEHLPQCLTTVIESLPCYSSLCFCWAPLNHLAPSSLQPHLSCGKTSVRSIDNFPSLQDEALLSATPCTSYTPVIRGSLPLPELN